MGRFPSGQREQTVNLPSQTSVVRIHPCPPSPFSGNLRKAPSAGMAELADAHDSGSCARTCLQVQVLFPAPPMDGNFDTKLPSILLHFFSYHSCKFQLFLPSFSPIYAGITVTRFKSATLPLLAALYAAGEKEEKPAISGTSPPKMHPTRQRLPQ